MTLIYLAALAALFVSRSGPWTRSPARSSTPGASTTSRRSSRAAPFRGVIWRTVWIAAAVTATCAVLAFPFAYFMARVASPRVRAMLFVLVLLPLWSSYLVRVYAWKVILANDGILNWSLEKIGLPGREHRLLEHGDVARVHLHLAALHDPAGLRGAGAHPALLHRGLARPRRLRVHDVPARDPAARAAGDRRRLDLHLLADARRLHHARPSSAAPARPSSATSSTRRAWACPGTCPSRRRSRRSRSSSWASTSCSRSARARSTRSDGTPRHPHRPLDLDDRRRPVPAPPDRDHHPLRVQRVGRPGLADHGLDDEVVQPGDPRRRVPGRADPVAEGGRARDRDRDGARHARRVRALPRVASSAGR